MADGMDDKVFSDNAPSMSEDNLDNNATVRAEDKNLKQNQDATEMMHFGIEKEMDGEGQTKGKYTSQVSGSEEEEDDSSADTSRELTKTPGPGFMRSDRQLKKINTWGFFDNQVFLCRDIDFGGQAFYGDGWMTIMGMELAKSLGELGRIQVVKTEETYEPKDISIEIKLALEEERKMLIEKKEEDGEYDIFKMVQEKEMEAFTDMFGTEEVEGEEMNKFNRFQFSSFEKQKCENHRNAFDLFVHNEEFFIVSKGFNHEKGNTRLQMKIHKFSPTVDDERGSIYQCHTVLYPIVDQNACLDPSMLSVV